jgi:thioredoxin reductase (NADPH)
MIADVVVIGSGPAGIQAAIHSSRKKVSTVLIGKITNSALFGTHIENYFGVSGAVEGSTLLVNSVVQAKEFGCTVVEQNVMTISQSNGIFTMTVESGEEITAKAVVLATGLSRKKLNIPGEKEFYGKGVSYCASCDCNFYKGVPIAIVGNDSEAAADAELMTKYASKVYWLTESPSADPSLVKKAVDAGVEIIPSFPIGISGSASVETMTLKGRTDIAVKGVFIELGGRSSVDIAMDLGLMPEADDTLKIDGACATSVVGVYACGDITGKPWQVAKAVGEGAIAGSSAAEYAKRSLK